MQPWIKKYEPKTSEDIVGRQKEIEIIKNHLKLNSKKPLLIYGGIGHGKTSIVHAVTNQLNYELVEMNASDKRNAKSINEYLEKVVHQGSLFGNKKAILIDEIDGLSGVKDRGGIGAVLKIATKSSYPIIMTAQDITNDKLKTVRKKSELLELAPLPIEIAASHLEKICQNEKITYNRNALKQLIRINNNDTRACINDLQTLQSEEITLNKINSLQPRNPSQKIEQALHIVFKSQSADITLRAYDDVSADPSEIIMWLEENISKEYTKNQELKQAYQNISRADMHLGRIRKRQYYRLYVYCYNLLSAGIALSKKERYTHKTIIKRNTRPLKIWISNMKTKKAKDIAAKISKKNHMSNKNAYKELNFMKSFLKNIPANILSNDYGLEIEEIAWLNNK